MSSPNTKASLFYAGGPVGGKRDRAEDGKLTHSAYPYYKRKYAEALKQVLDIMMLDKVHDRRFLCSDFHDIRQNTLYLIVTQGYNYLIDYMDTDDRRYAKFRKDIMICKDKDALGVSLRWKYGKGVKELTARRVGKDRAVILKSVTISNEEQLAPQEWRHRLMEFLQSEIDGEILYQEGLSLTEADMHLLGELVDAPGVHILILEPTRFKLFRGDLPDDPTIK